MVWRRRFLFPFLVVATLLGGAAITFHVWRTSTWGMVSAPDDVLRDRLIAICKERRMPSRLPADGFAAGTNPRVAAHIGLGKARRRSARIVAWSVTSGTQHKLVTKSCASERRPAEFPVDRHCYVVLWDYEPESEAGEQTQRMSCLWVSGLSRGGIGSFFQDEIPMTHSRISTGAFRAGQTRLFYAEGDREFTLRQGMTVDDFAAENDGTYLVLTVTMQ